MLIQMTINNEKKELHCDADDMLLNVLRRAGYKSVKCGCDTTNCGLCTVWLDDVPVLSCSVPACRCHQRKITTLEGLQSEVDIIGKLLVEEGADQCVFCSPGLLMNVIAMKKEFILNGNIDPSDEEIQHFLSGNLCRCTGYMGQLRAIRKYIEREGQSI